MKTTNLIKFDFFVAGAGVVLSVASWLFMGRQFGLDVLLGAFIALLNWIVFRWIGVRIAAAGGGVRFVFFLVIKVVTIIAVIVLILVKTGVNPLAFMVGISALMPGVLFKVLVDTFIEGENILKKDSDDAP